MSALWAPTGRARQADTAFANAGRKGAGSHEKLWRLSHLPEWAFSPSMSHWDWRQAHLLQATRTRWSIEPPGCRVTRAVQMFTRFTGVQISEATARRHTYHRGKAALAVQNAQASLSPALTGSVDPEEQVIVSPDGAMVPLVGGEWAEVKTVVVGKVERAGPDEQVHSTQLSYFSRMLDAQTFTEQASGELLRRGVDRGKQVGAVMDGAEWIDGFLDDQCPDALRILDFAQAAE